MLIAKKKDVDLKLLPSMAARHGCITGATGTGKTVTLQKLAESFSNIGVPVFLADVKGDLTGVSQPGLPSGKIKSRFDLLEMELPQWSGSPVTLWDVQQERGHPLRATISDMGPLLLARLLNLNETQAGLLELAFKVADDQNLLLLDLKDLRALLQFLGQNASRFRMQYGNISSASVGAIQRGLLQLEKQGGDKFFGEPMLNSEDLLQTVDGKGVINILVADKLLNAPKLYSTFLLWLLSDLYENLPEVGDCEKPRLIFIFDEAYLLFNMASPALLDKIEQVVRLIRSKGVGVYFVTQNPFDIPEKILSQLGNRIQHALRTYTPRDKKAVNMIAETMRTNPELDLRQAITELAVGEALISFLQFDGSPSVTERAYILPPISRIGPVTPDERKELLSSSLVAGVYDQAVDRHSAFEMLQERVGSLETIDNQAPHRDRDLWKELRERVAGTSSRKKSSSDGVMDAFAKSAARSIGSTIAREITRGLLGSLLGRRRR